MVRRITITLVSLLAFASASVAADRLQVPGGAKALRSTMGLPEAVTDDMLLVEAVRSWYGARDAITSPAPGLLRLLGYLQSNAEPLADGPPLPLGNAAWERLLKCAKPCNLAAALVANRQAMLLYHGLIAMDQETQHWMAAHPELLVNLLAEGAAAFSFAGPFVHIRGDAVLMPGGQPMHEAWESVLGDRVTRPESFIRELMRRNGGRMAWLFAAVSQLDAAHQKFALADGESALSALARRAVSSAPEWTVAERPFWRTPFDFSLVLAVTELSEGGAPRGSRSFWREVFRSDDLTKWRSQRSAPLTAPALLEMIFEQPLAARERWEVFCLGQHLAGVERDAEEAGLILRGARQHPALAQLLDRIGVAAPQLVLSLHRAAARVFERDPTGERTELPAWQGALAVIERAALSGGLDATTLDRTLSGFAALPLDDIRADVTTWVMEALLPTLAGRPGAPPDAERLLLQAMSGRLTPAGPRSQPNFTWEDLTYSFGAPISLVPRMEEARQGQRAASMEDARVAWRIAKGTAASEAEGLATRLRDYDVPLDARDLADRIDRARQERDTTRLKREGRRAAETIVMAALPALAYVPHLAATDTPALGADVAFRHEFVARDDGPNARRLRPWQVARGQSAPGGGGWRLQGSLLMLDLTLAEWYLRRPDEPAATQPMFDEGDMIALAQIASMARSGDPSRMGLSDAVAGMQKGREAASAASSMAALDELLERAGIDPWRRWAIARASNPAEAAAGLLLGEAWRIGGAPGLLSPHPAIDGGAHFGRVPSSTALMEGRRSAGVIGACSVDAQLRVAVFLQSRQLPDRLFGDVVAGVLADLIQNTPAARPDDLTTFAVAARQLDDTRLEEHLLALVADGTLARPSAPSH